MAAEHWQGSASSVKADEWMNEVDSLAVAHRHCVIPGCNAEDPDNLPAQQVQAESLHHNINSHAIVSRKVFP